MSGFQDGPLRAEILKRLETAIQAASDAICATTDSTVAPESLTQDSRIILKNESHLHKVPPQSEMHFNCTVASDIFRYPPYQSRLQRHRFVHEAVGHDLLLQVDGAAPKVHMLTIHAWTLDEWRERGGAVEASPPCLGR